MLFVLTIICAACASFIQRVCGFGFGIFVMMFFPYYLESYGASITLSGLLAGSTALYIAIVNRHYIRWNIMWRIVAFNIFVSFLAIEFMASMSNEILKRMFGIALIVMSLYFMFLEKRVKLLKESPFMESIVGAVSGFMGGVLAMPGPAIVVYTINILRDKREYMATLQAFSVIFNVFYTVFRTKAGFFSPIIPLLWAVGLFGIIAGTWVGAKLYKKITVSELRFIVYIMMIISGVVAIIRSY